MQEYLTANTALLNVIFKGKSLDVSFAKGDSPLSKQIAYGVLRHYYELTTLLKNLLTKPLPKKHLDLELLLMAGIYSIDHLNRPSHTSVNAVVESTIKLNKKWAKALVNGVLRQYIRQKDALREDIPQESLCNHPLWLQKRISNAYPKLSEQIYIANNKQAPMTLRVNTLKGTAVDYQKTLSDAGIQSKLGEYATDALILDQAVSIESLPKFAAGFVSVQDQASQLIPNLLNLRANLSVLDACAAPGGKTCHILEACNEVKLVALDISVARLNLIKENLLRLDLDCELTAADLREFESTEKFDRILLDAPCSASGIIRRHPDIKLLRRDEDIDKLALTQLELLVKAWSLLKEDGELVYSTCSILPTENEHVIDAFLKVEASAQAVTIDASWGEMAGTGRQLLPSNDDESSNTSTSTDGFFFAKLLKKSI
ncbi:MAG: 16S rRNA (cytosine967-C5)-methyltransferase [Candidatus Azotimanducaceae bacterium]|jgi:16S rRNA (cytosine967-C5)-methyltransferase